MRHTFKTKETGRRGWLHHTRYWDLGDGWEVRPQDEARTRFVTWEAYRRRDALRITGQPFYSKADALAFHKAAA